MCRIGLAGDVHDGVARLDSCRGSVPSRDRSGPLIHPVNPTRSRWVAKVPALLGSVLYLRSCLVGHAAGSFPVLTRNGVRGDLGHTDASGWSLVRG